MNLRIAALVKQIPAFEHMEIGADGRLQREGVPLEMSAYCRRAVAEGVLLAAETAGRCTVITLGPAAAEAVLREALAYGADDAVLVSDPAFAGSDTLATAKALAAVVARRGPFDLILVGRNSLDAETGQVGPQLAALLDLPFLAGVKHLELTTGPGGTNGERADGGAPVVAVGCEQDDAWLEATVMLPAVLSTAERLIDPCKVKDPDLLAAVDPARIETITAAALGPGPWGQAASPTRVGTVRVDAITRRRERLGGSVTDQVAQLVEILDDRGLLDPLEATPATETEPEDARVAHRGGDANMPMTEGGPVVAVLMEAGRQRVLRELLGGAAELAAELDGRVVAIGEPLLSPMPDAAAVAHVLWTWGADEVVVTDAPGVVPEDIAAAIVADVDAATPPGIVLAPSTSWGREVAARLAVAWDAGLTGDAVDLELDAAPGGERRLIAWKPAFGAAMVAAIETTSAAQLVTMRAGVLPVPVARDAQHRPDEIPIRTIATAQRGRVRVTAHRREDDLDVLANATRVISVGVGVDPEDYPRLDPLLQRLGAELAATRKVTDNGWLPHARQVGITGASLAPDLVLVVGASGKFNHMVGWRRAGLVVAVNPDPDAPVFGFADYGLVADWREVLDALDARLTLIQA